MAGKTDKVAANNVSSSGYSTSSTDRTVIDLIEQHALSSPDAAAVSIEDDILTYKDLNQRATQLAYYLKSKGIGKGSVVPVSVTRSTHLFVSLLAVLKAGAAFAPINSSDIHKRIKHILEDTKAELLIFDEHAIKTIGALEVTCPVFDIHGFQFDSMPSEPVDRCVSTSDPAYVLYTSGPTGQPKGAVIPHCGLTTLCEWHWSAYSTIAESNAAVLSDIGFDAFIFETFPFLTAGATLFPLTDDQRLDATTIVDFYSQNSITHAHVPSSLVQAILGTGKIDNVLKLSTSGERLTISSAIGAVNLYNNYGATECSVVSCHYKVKEDEVGDVSIGHPSSNAQITILDSQDQLAVVGGEGELCVSGPSLALGYLNNLELSAESFVDNPQQPGAALYRTGDRVILQSDGSLDYVGRLDSQVTISGHRIELSEIEAHVISHQNISQTCVIAKGSGDDTELVCYYSSLTQHLSDELVHSFLQEKLPAYMVPAVYSGIDSLPVNASGKVDRELLHDTYLDSLTADQGVVESVQDRVISIWSELLSIERSKIRTDQNFFNMGGHSLKLITMSNKLKIEFGVRVPVVDIFRLQNIERLTEFIETAMQPERDSKSDNRMTITI